MNHICKTSFETFQSFSKATRLKRILNFQQNLKDEVFMNSFHTAIINVFEKREEQAGFVNKVDLSFIFKKAVLVKIVK